MPGQLARILSILAAALVLSGPALSEPMMPGTRSNVLQNPILLPAHGFHCKPRPGWDGRVGRFRWHTHEGICKDWHRCFRIHKKCLKAFGDGFNQWKYESCLLHYGCY